MAINIGGMRSAYKSGCEVFTEDQLAFQEPIKQFELWFNEASKIPEIIEPNAMCLATATREGVPSCRMVLLKGYGTDGFIFFTNYQSRKGKDLADNPKASLCFYWEPLKRSIRIEGDVEMVSEQESIEYFNSRPKSSQIGACVSPQSQVIKSREVLTEKLKDLEITYSDENSIIPKPEHWGGFCVKPQCIEFWQGQTNRVHDRIIYRKKCLEEIKAQTKSENEWIIERLAP